MQIPVKWRLRLRALYLLAALAFFISIFLCCCLYIYSGHHALAGWYLHLNGCFYHSGTWGTDFFTPGIKSDGNMYCVIGMGIAATGAASVLRRLWARPAVSALTLGLRNTHLLPLLICLAVAVGAWQWGNGLSLPAFDEVFSAQNAAGIHPFQCASYYMLPNNHLLYNLINSLLFHFADDKVVTGRLLSLGAYVAFMVTVYGIMYRWLHSRWLALLTAIALSLQFFTWGFSFQARGYELYLLAQWGLLIAAVSYAMAPARQWLRLSALCIVVGYFCMPSFMYFHAALLVFMLVVQVRYKTRDLVFWQYQAIAVALTFVCYLPALCFSGLESITHNSYVAPMSHTETFSALWHKIWPFLQVYVSHIFSGAGFGAVHLGWLLFCLPLVLLFSRKDKLSFLLGLFYVSMWAMCLLMIIVMKRLPFERNLIGQYSVTLAAALWVIYVYTGIAAGGRPLLRALVYAAAPVLFIVHFINTNTVYLKDTLYEIETNSIYTNKVKWLGIIPKNSTIAFSDAEFYPLYICKKEGYTVSKCPAGNEDYYVKQGFEPMPAAMTGNYVLLTASGGYEIYKRR